jgi:hypothetical protein
MLCGSEEIGEQLDASVNQETDVDAGSDDFCIGRLFLVQVPCSSNTQEVTTVTESVENQDNDVQHLVECEIEN